MSLGPARAARAPETARSASLGRRLAASLIGVVPVWACTALSGTPGGAVTKTDTVLYRDESHYAAFPSLLKGDDDQVWVSFGWNTTRSHYGKAAGGKTGSASLYSSDGGRRWLRSGVDRQYTKRPEDLGPFKLSDGTLIHIGPRMHEVLPAEKKDELVKRGVAVKEWPDGHISASYRVRMWRRSPGEEQGRASYVELPRFASMGGFGRGVVLADNTILKPVYGRRTPDEPVSRTWVLRSVDRGETWDLIDVAADGVHSFNEAELLALPDGAVLAMIRAESGTASSPLDKRGFLWQTMSRDGGRTWGAPAVTRMWGYPPHLLLLRNGDVLCTYGYRRPPFGIRACFSRDGGRTWDVAREAILRRDALPDGPGPGKGAPGDLGYPRSVELSDGTILTVYYLTLGDGVTHIAATRWHPSFVGPAELARGDAAVPRPDPSLPPERIVGEEGATPLVYGLLQSFLPVHDRIAMIAVRVSEKSSDPELIHTNGLSVAVRKPGTGSWWTKILGASKVLKPAHVRCGAWNAFVFDPPLTVTPEEMHVLTVYNKDYTGGGETKLKDGLEGDHRWFINTGQGGVDDYPNGGIGPTRFQDLAFKVYSEPGELPSD